MSVTFRDESNDSSSVLISYIDATVTALNHPLIVRSKASLASAVLQYHSCGGNFIIRLYLIPLISSQNIVSLIKTFPPFNQTWPESSASMKRTPMHGPTLQDHNDASLWSTRTVPAGRISTLLNR